jgi:hypothetical protein
MKLLSFKDRLTILNALHTASVHLVEILFPFSHKIYSQGLRILTQAIPLLAPGAQNKTPLRVSILCAGEDSNLRRPKPTGLQPVVIDHSTTDAIILLC